MDLQLNRRRPGSGTGPVFRSGVNIPNVSKLRQMPQPQRMMAQMVQTVSSKNEFTDSNIPFLVEQINRLKNEQQTGNVCPDLKATPVAMSVPLTAVTTTGCTEFKSETSLKPQIGIQSVTAPSSTAAAIAGLSTVERLAQQPRLQEPTADDEAVPVGVSKRSRGRPKRYRDDDPSTCSSLPQGIGGSADVGTQWDTSTTTKRKYAKGINGHQYMQTHRDHIHLGYRGQYKGKGRGYPPVNETDIVVIDSEKLWTLVAANCDTLLTDADVATLSDLIDLTEPPVVDPMARPVRSCSTAMNVGIDVADFESVVQEIKAENYEKVEGKRFPMYRNSTLEDILTKRNAILARLQEQASRELRRLKRLTEAEVVFAKSGVRQSSESYNRTLEAAYSAICARKTLLGYGVRSDDMLQRLRRRNRNPSNCRTSVGSSSGSSSRTCGTGAAPEASAGIDQQCFNANNSPRSQDEIIHNGLLLMHSNSNAGSNIVSVMGSLAESKPFVIDNTIAADKASSINDTVIVAAAVAAVVPTVTDALDVDVPAPRNQEVVSTNVVTTAATATSLIVADEEAAMPREGASILPPQATSSISGDVTALTDSVLMNVDVDIDAAMPVPVPVPVSVLPAPICVARCTSGFSSISRSGSAGSTPVSAGRPGTRIANGVQLQTKYNVRIYGPDTVMVPDVDPGAPIKATVVVEGGRGGTAAGSVCDTVLPSSSSSSRTKRRRFQALLQQGPYSLLKKQHIALCTDYLSSSGHGCSLVDPHSAPYFTIDSLDVEDNNDDNVKDMDTDQGTGTDVAVDVDVDVVVASPDASMAVVEATAVSPGLTISVPINTNDDAPMPSPALPAVEPQKRQQLPTSTVVTAATAIPSYNEFIASLRSGDLVDYRLQEEDEEKTEEFKGNDDSGVFAGTEPGTKTAAGVLSTTKNAGLWVAMRVVAVFRDDRKITRFLKVRPCSGYSPLCPSSGNRHTSRWISVEDFYADSSGKNHYKLAPRGHFMRKDMLNRPLVG